MIRSENLNLLIAVFFVAGLHSSIPSCHPSAELTIHANEIVIANSKYLVCKFVQEVDFEVSIQKAKVI